MPETNLMTETNLAAVIFVGGIATYAMRSAGIWLRGSWTRAAWLDELPFAVILVLTVSSLAGLCETWREVGAGLLASGAIVVASRLKLPFIVGLAIGCGVYGLLVPT